jgi:hypothetical protein
MERKMHQRRTRREKKKSDEKPEDKAARRTATATVWIAIFTIVLAGVGVLTLIELIEGGADTKALVDASKKQACAANRFAQSASNISDTMSDTQSDFAKMAGNSEKAIKTTQTQMRLDQRAWLVATAISLGTVEDGKPITYSAMGVNTGKTPGRKVIIHNHASFSAIEIKTEKDLTSKVVKVAPSSVGLVAPNSPFSSTQEEVPAENVPLVKSRLGEHGCSYVWGEITYEDIFHSQRISTFCSYRCLRPGYENLRWCKFYNEAN